MDRPNPQCAYLPFQLITAVAFVLLAAVPVGLRGYRIAHNNKDHKAYTTPSSTLYKRALHDPSPCLPAYLAAVSALTTALSQSTQPLTTLSETLALLSTLTGELKRSLPHATALAISAGTDTFQRQLVTTLAACSNNGNGTSPTTPVAEKDIRAAITAASQGFINKQLSLRARIPAHGRRIIRAGATVLVSARSKLVEEVLLSAAQADIPFRVIFVRPSDVSTRDEQSDVSSETDLETLLHNREIPTTSIPASALAHVLDPSSFALTPTAESRRLYPPQDTIVLMGAWALLASGGVLAESVASTAAVVAKSCGREVWVVSEFGKCVRDVGLRGVGRGGLRWEGGEDVEGEGSENGVEDLGDGTAEEGFDEVLDVIPQSLITGFITEDGPRNGTAVVEEAVKLWF